MHSLAAATGAVILAIFMAAAAPPKGSALLGVAPEQFRPVEGPSSGPAVYYQALDDGGTAILRGTYVPGLETVTMGVEIPDAARKRVRQLRWRWRVHDFPVGGDECRPGKGDSAASVNVVFKRGLKWFVLKYVWSSVGPLGATCDRKRSLTLNRDTVVLESGGRTGVWLSELVDVRRSFREHFADGDPEAEVPDMVGIGLMTDGDQTESPASADWADFELVE